jgi:hypothetical protein
MARPNFLIIGDVKAGTTSLYSYLRQHPDIYMPELKELRYFAYDAENPYHVRSQNYGVRDLEDYLHFFAQCGNEHAIGEASPNYLRSPGAASRIQRQLGDVRLIVSLRHPADRLYSLYQMHVRAGGKHLAFDETAFGREATWIKGNFYWPELLRFYELFPREQIHVVLFDDLKTRTAEVVQDLYRFLGVDPTFKPVLERQNEGGGTPKSAAVYSVVLKARDRLKRLGVVPSGLRRRWRRLRKHLLEQNEMPETVRRKIIDICREDIHRTEKLIRRDLSAWLTQLLLALLPLQLALLDLDALFGETVIG